MAETETRTDADDVRRCECGDMLRNLLCPVHGREAAADPDDMLSVLEHDLGGES